MKKKDKNKKIKKKKNRIKLNKEIKKLLLISVLLFIFGLIIFKKNTFTFSYILACIPYGYSLLDFLGEEKFKKFGKIDFIISFIVRVVLGTFIGVVSWPVKIGYSLLDKNIEQEG